MSRVKVLVAAVAVFVWSVTPTAALDDLKDRVPGRDRVDVTVTGARMPAVPDGAPKSLSDPARTVSVLAGLRSVPRRPQRDGYARAAFGKGWKDGPDRDGCDARNDMLADSLESPVFKAGSDCVVVAGTLRDPYTGRAIKFRKSDASKVQIDHLIPLAYAWDAGAASWPATKRVQFANDPINLIAVDGAANQSKSDSTPGSWMPVNRGYACTYIRRVALVAYVYDVPLPEFDIEAMTDTAKAAC